MNNLRTDVPGGWPIKLNDIRWIQDAFRGGFDAVFGHLPQDSVVVLTGLSMPGTPGNTVSSGVVYYNGEIYEVEETSLVNGTHVLWDFEPQLSVESGVKTLETGSEYLAHEIRKAKLYAVNPSFTPTPETRRFIWAGALHEHTLGYYDVMASRFDPMPLGVVMLWPFPPDTIPLGWEAATGQTHNYLGTGPIAGPDYRRAVIAGFDDAASPPFNTVGNAQNGLDLVFDAASPQRRVIAIWIIKVSYNVPAIFTY
jgi:hypothetical protein